jgi:hypothetical protein
MVTNPRSFEAKRQAFYGLNWFNSMANVTLACLKRLQLFQSCAASFLNAKFARCHDPAEAVIKQEA